MTHIRSTLPRSSSPCKYKE